MGTKIGKAATFEGRPCTACTATLRYHSSRACVACSIRRASAASARRYATPSGREEILKRNRESARRWHAENPAASRSKTTRWNKENPGAGAARAMRNLCRVEGLVPAWCETGTDAGDAVDEFYLLAPVFTAAFKPRTPYQVDHVKPRSLGGEHRPDNLQWLPKHLNQAKGNKWPG